MGHAGTKARFFALPFALDLVEHQQRIAPYDQARGLGIGPSVAQSLERGFECSDQRIVFGFVVGHLLAKLQLDDLLGTAGPAQGIAAIAKAGVAAAAAVEDDFDRLLGSVTGQGRHGVGIFDRSGARLGHAQAPRAH